MNVPDVGLVKINPMAAMDAHVHQENPGLQLMQLYKNNLSSVVFL